MTLFGKKTILKKARKRDMPDGLWLKCPGCNEMIFGEEQEKALRVCPLCGHHFAMGRSERLAMLAGCAAVYVAATLAAGKKSIRLFEKQDL